LVLDKIAHGHESLSRIKGLWHFQFSWPCVAVGRRPRGHGAATRGHGRYGGSRRPAGSTTAAKVSRQLVSSASVGGRRLAACRSLGWSDVPATVIDIDKIARGEYAENHFRKAFAPSEEVAIVREIRPAEEAAAKERQREHGNTAPGRKTTWGKFP
jgi:hypothetical protein